MSDEPGPSGEAESVPERAHLSRLELLTDVAIFQLKLIADGFRDILLSPLSILAAVAGLVVGGDRPERYFRKVIGLGRRTEVWIDLFDEHRGPGTAEEFVAPVRSKVIREAQANAWLSKTGTKLNRRLDQVNSALAPGDPNETLRGSPPDPVASQQPDPGRTMDADDPHPR